MVQVTRTFTLPHPAEQVLDYLADFSHAVDWDPGTQSCEREGSGPVEVGATWHNVSKIMGREVDLSYRLARREPGRVTLVGTNKSATSTDDITAHDTADGCELTYEATIELNGVFKLAAPVMKIAMEKLGDETVDGIKGAAAHM